MFKKFLLKNKIKNYLKKNLSILSHHYFIRNEETVSVVCEEIRFCLWLSNRYKLILFHAAFAEILNDPFFVYFFSLMVKGNIPDLRLKKVFDNLNYRLIFIQNPDFQLDYYYKMIPALCKVGIVVPVYNVEKYLGECLRSLLNQTYGNVEIICVNDGSTDNSLKVLKEYAKKDNRIKVFSQSNKGLAGARNTGLKYCNSEYVIFVDSDDLLDSQTVEYCCMHMNNKNIDFCTFGVKAFDDRKNSKFNLIKFQKWCNDCNKLEGIRPIPKDLSLNFFPSACNKMFRLSIIMKNKISFPNYMSEDLSWIWKYTLSCKNFYYASSKQFYYYRKRDASFTDKISSRHAEDLLPNGIHVFKFLSNRPDFDEYEFLIANFFITHFMAGWAGLKFEMSDAIREGIQKFKKCFPSAEHLFQKKLSNDDYLELILKNRFPDLEENEISDIIASLKINLLSDEKG